ncbi:hypothetical protein [Streptomyces sp. NPDC007905]|uniref:hypothetical protein n=1 Tax=Streptomyces sp. NPDC007905 TaxID=3364788 RepID=UPI0036E2F74F
MQSTVSKPLFRRFVATVAAGAALATTTGCTVPVDAVPGISVTGDGHLLGVMMVCGHRIDGAALYVDSADADRTVTVGSWTADRPLGAGLATWPLDAPSAGWTASRSRAPLTAGTIHILYGWTKDDSWSSGSVSFTLADRDRLTPGTALYDGVSAGGDASQITVPMAKFKATACQDGDSAPPFASATPEQGSARIGTTQPAA